MLMQVFCSSPSSREVQPAQPRAVWAGTRRVPGLGNAAAGPWGQPAGAALGRYQSSPEEDSELKACPAQHPFRVTVQDVPEPKAFLPDSSRLGDRCPGRVHPPPRTAATAGALSPCTRVGGRPVGCPGLHPQGKPPRSFWVRGATPGTEMCPVPCVPARQAVSPAGRGVTLTLALLPPSTAPQILQPGDGGRSFW